MYSRIFILFTLLILQCTLIQSQTCSPPCQSNICCSKWGFCGISNDHCGEGCKYGPCHGSIPPSPPTPPPSPPSPPPPPPGEFRVTHEQLKTIMGTTNDLSVYVGPINTALSQNGMNTPIRAANFLAQVRHETAGLTSFYQVADNGAGAIHMLPVNFRRACKEMSEIRTGFERRFPSCSAPNKCDCGNDIEAGLVIAQPEYSFLTGVWWYRYGARLPELMGWMGCGDLREDADRGLGSKSPPTGYYQVSRCIFGNIEDKGLDQRLSFYRIAKSALGAKDPSAATEGETATYQTNGGNGGLQNSVILAITLSVVAVVISIAIVALFIYNMKLKNRTEEGV